jgi:uracil-DNA glycosylase
MSEAIEDIQREVVGCRACPRLVEWRERVGREKRRAFADEEYWARPVPAFGDPEARMLVVGLAPAAHGANRTGRMFTGDRSGDWLYAALHRAGFASQPTSVAAGDGLELTRRPGDCGQPLRSPANRPTPEERNRCAPYLLREIRALSQLRVIVALGGFAWDQVLRLLREEPGFTVPSPRPRFGHGAEVQVATGIALLGCYHPSQQNTFTGRLTPGMLDDVFRAARQRL